MPAPMSHGHGRRRRNSPSPRVWGFAQKRPPAQKQHILRKNGRKSGRDPACSRSLGDVMADGCDAKRLVALGYDQIANEYLARYGASSVREYWLSELIRRLSNQKRARVLDLGCGAGIPITRELAALGHDVMGVDNSARQIALAGRNIPDAEFIQADMTAIDLLPASFDAVAAFYSITHAPRSEHADLLKRIASWLRPGGVFVGSMGAGSLPDRVDTWMGTEMFFSHYDAKTNLTLLRESGLTIERSEEVDQDNEDARFLWVVAKQP
jgi:SAM-dependent methyltransferase